MHLRSKTRAKDELPPSSGAKLLTKSQTKIDETTAAVSKPLTGEKVLDFMAKFAEIELIVMDDNGQLLTSNIKGCLLLSVLIVIIMLSSLHLVLCNNRNIFRCGNQCWY